MHVCMERERGLKREREIEIVREIVRNKNTEKNQPLITSNVEGLKILIKWLSYHCTLSLEKKIKSKMICEHWYDFSLILCVNSAGFLLNNNLLKIKGEDMLCPKSPSVPFLYYKCICNYVIICNMLVQTWCTLIRGWIYMHVGVVGSKLLKLTIYGSQFPRKVQSPVSLYIPICKISWIPKISKSQLPYRLFF